MKFSMKAAALLATIFAATANADIINTYDVDFATQPLVAHQQNGGTYGQWTNNRGSVLNLNENAWFTLNLNDAFGIANLDLDNTDSSFVLSFDFRALNNANPSAYTEIGGIWLADFTNGETDNDASRTLKLEGSQNFGLDVLEYTKDPKWQSFSIDLDTYMSGLVTDIVFINDCDKGNGCGDIDVRFANVKITEVSEPTAMSLILLGVGFMGWRARRQK